MIINQSSEPDVRLHYYLLYPAKNIMFTLETYLVVAIALDRVWAIVTPLTSHPSLATLTSLTWSLALLPCLPCLYMFDGIRLDNKDICVSK